MAAQDSQSTIVSDFGTAASSPAPREAPESPPAECRWGDGAAVAGWLCCLAVFLAGVWERTVLPMRRKSRADPLYYTGIVMIAVGTLVLLCYFVVRLEQVRAAARTPFSPSDMHEWVALIPGVVTVKARREAPVVRRVSNFLLELGAFVLFCVEIKILRCPRDACSMPVPHRSQSQHGRVVAEKGP